MCHDFLQTIDLKTPPSSFQFPFQFKRLFGSPCRYFSCHENLSVRSEWTFFICVSREEYEKRKYIQVHNKFQSVRLTTDKTGHIVSMKKEINKFCKYTTVLLNIFYTRSKLFKIFQLQVCLEITRIK